MKHIIVNTQKELDKIKRIEKDQVVEVNVALRLTCQMECFGKLILRAGLDCSFWDGRYVEAWGNASVVARGNASVVAWGNASVVAWENASVVARGNSVVRAFSDFCKTVLHGFSVCFATLDLKFSFEIKSEFALVHRYKDLGWFENNAVEKKEKFILYKRVSHDFKTQEGAENETLWAIGSTLEHPDWQPESGECGPGKFHGVSRPYFADEFRSERNDRYIAIEVALADVHEWPNPSYPHKIGFRKGTVLYECNRLGKEIKLPVKA